MVMVDVDDISLHADSPPKTVDLVWELTATWCCSSSKQTNCLYCVMQ